MQAVPEKVMCATFEKYRKVIVRFSNSDFCFFNHDQLGTKI